MDEKQELAVVRNLPTHGEVSSDLMLAPDEVYERILEWSLLENMSLEEALGEAAPDVSGVSVLDAFPASVDSQMRTGIFPPATEAEISYLELENKNAGRAECLRRMLSSGSLTLADTKGYRTRTAYRLVRQMARVRGILEGFDMLQVAMNIAANDTLVSMWHLPVPLVDSEFITGNRGIRAVLGRMDVCGDTYLFNTPGGFLSFSGSTTLPPPIPDRFFPSNPVENWKARISRKVPEGYDPRLDEPLILYCEAMTVLAEQLNVSRGAPEEPWAGEYGLAGLLNPYTARVCWPTRDELVLYEEEFILKVFDKAIHVSTRATETWLQQFFGLSRLEAMDIVKTAVRVGSVLYNEGTEEMRNLEMKRIDNLEDVCDRANDPRAQIAAKRLKWQALGLTQREDGETASVLKEAAIAGIRSVEEEEEDEEES